jgi:NAD(P)-dependent dehydrogenase (short-subunit alcohol dehydrogenase family)
MLGRHWTTADVPGQAGRTAVVTGGNTGLGLEVARVLARAGARVVIAARDPEKAKWAVADIATGVRRAQMTSAQRASGANGAAPALVETVRLDLASLASVREAAAELRERCARIDLLVNNAGVMMTPFSRTEDGFERQIGTNHLGPFAFTGLLLDRITRRVVTVASIVHRRGTIDFGSFTSDSGYRRSGAYAQSKLANLLFTYELERRLEKAGSTTIALAAHPGYSTTGLDRYLPSLVQAGARATAPLIAQSPARGALPVLRAATDPDAKGGQFWGPDGLAQLKGYPRLVKSSARSHDARLAMRLWEESERLTGVIPRVRES